jgi:2'-5' RNA ligase
MAEVRLFVAVNLNREIKDTIQLALDRFPVQRPPWRWVKTDNLHLTLKFLGDTPEARIPRLVDSLEAVGRAHPPFTIQLDQLGGFPNLRKPRVLFYKVSHGAEPLSRLATAVDRTLQDRMDLPAERKPFRAHLTVARIKRPLPGEVAAQLTEVPPLPPASQLVSSLDLMQSELRREGAVYHCLKEIALK